MTKTIQSHISDFKEGRIDRRGFMTGAIALGMTVATATATMKQVEAATPKRGGHMRMGIGSGSTTQVMDPALIEDTFSQVFAYGCLNNTLTGVQTDGSLGPELAESWEASDDATTWVFKLKKGVEFHNGKTVDADDVIASIQHHQGEDSQSVVKALVESVKEIKKDGPDSIAFTLDGGNADFAFTMSDIHFCIMPSKDGKVVDPNSGVGTGPFIFKDYEPGVRASAERNPNYFREGPWVDSVEILAIHDVVARTNAMTTGEVDVMDRCDLKTVNLLKRQPGVEVTAVTGFLHYTFPMRTDTAPYDNNDLRLALKYGVDREALVQTILQGYGTLGNDHPISTANRYHASDLPQRPYDPDKAKFHLKKAGLSEVTVDLHASDGAFAGSVDAATLYKEHAAPAGITINVLREPADGYWSNIWMQKAWCACYWSGRATEDLMFSTGYKGGAPWNDTFWTHEKFDKLLIEARAELDEAKRREMYVEMQRIVSDEGGVVVPMFANFVGAHTDKLTHGEIGNNYDMDGGRLGERWWFA